MELERAFVRNLSPQSKFKRFMGELKELSPDQLHAFTHPDHERESVYVVIRSTVGGRGGDRGRAATWSSRAARAASSRSPSPTRGRARASPKRLMNALIRDAKARGLKRIEGFVLGANNRMLDFVPRARLRGSSSSPDDPAVRVARLDLREPVAT